MRRRRHADWTNKPTRPTERTRPPPQGGAEAAARTTHTHTGRRVNDNNIINKKRYCCSYQTSFSADRRRSYRRSSSPVHGTRYTSARAPPSVEDNTPRLSAGETATATGGRTSKPYILYRTYMDVYVCMYTT